MIKKTLLSLCLVVALTACGDQNKASTGKPKLGLVVSTLNNPFFVDLRNGAIEAATSMGYDLVVLDSQNDVAKELSNIEDLISSNVAAILLNPTDSDSSAKAASLVLDANIPLISLDRNLNGINVATHVASDNAAGGRMAAIFIKEVVVPGGKIIELQGIPGTSAARERGTGFDEEMRSLGLTVAAKQTANFDRSQGLTVTENLLQVHPDTKGIFAHNDEMALGAQRAVADAGLDVVIVGFDATPDAVAAVDAGLLAATIAQQPGLIGALGVENAVKLINGEIIPTSIPVELQLVTQKQ